MRALGTFAALATIASAAVGIILNVRRDRQMRAAYEAGQASSGYVPQESALNKALRVGAWLAFILLVLSMAVVFLASVVKNVGSF